MLNKHLILTGFKHVGKSTLGRLLADKLSVRFLDLDQEIEYEYYHHYSQRLTCRQIMYAHGELHFRNMESCVLAKIIAQKPSVIALGGGAALSQNNQEILQENTIFHITANPDVIYERIISGGIPAFFSDVMQPKESFDKLWQERDNIYKAIAHYRIDNTFEIENALNNMLSRIIK